MLPGKWTMELFPYISVVATNLLHLQFPSGSTFGVMMGEIWTTKVSLAYPSELQDRQANPLGTWRSLIFRAPIGFDLVGFYSCRQFWRVDLRDRFDHLDRKHILRWKSTRSCHKYRDFAKALLSFPLITLYIDRTTPTRSCLACQILLHLRMNVNHGNNKKEKSYF